MVGIREIIAIGKLMWNLVKNAKEFARLQEENPRLKAELAACRAEQERLKAAHQAELAALATLKADKAEPASSRKDPKENWDVPQGYEAFSPQPGVTVYRFSPPDGSMAAEHFLCPNCLHLWGGKIMLRFKGDQMRVGKCPHCWSTYRFKAAKPFF